jgi:hypothetical protein
MHLCCATTKCWIANIDKHTDLLLSNITLWYTDHSGWKICMQLKPPHIISLENFSTDLGKEMFGNLRQVMLLLYCDTDCTVPYYTVLFCDTKCNVLWYLPHHEQATKT